MSARRRGGDAPSPRVPGGAAPPEAGRRAGAARETFRRRGVAATLAWDRRPAGLPSFRAADGLRFVRLFHSASAAGAGGVRPVRV
jgi:hypothetical protein